ncbi:MAG: hypothetical protein L6Q31_12190 [Fimbriimonadaceae bacterium]|nr:hypothetical protein [Fimbriimonadaceae bacterium]
MPKTGYKSFRLDSPKVSYQQPLEKPATIRKAVSGKTLSGRTKVKLDAKKVADVVNRHK